MKCIKNKTTEQVRRLTNAQAARTIEHQPDDNGHKYVYVPKSVWKKAGRPC